MRPIDPDSIDRVAKLLVDAGDAASFTDAETLLRTYRMQLLIGADACAEAAWQAAALSIVNTGTRAMHGGVTVVLEEDSPCLVPYGHGQPLSSVLARLGGTLAEQPEPDVATIVLGQHEPPQGTAPALWPTAEGWIASVTPTLAATPGTAAEIPAAVLAASLAVSRSSSGCEATSWQRTERCTSRSGTPAGSRTVRRLRTCPPSCGCSGSGTSARPTRGCSACCPTRSRALVRCSCRTMTG